VFPAITVNFYSQAVHVSLGSRFEIMPGSMWKRSPVNSLASRIQSMGGEAKLNLAVKMTSTLYEVTMDSIRKRHPGISKKKLFQLTRRRLQGRPPIWIQEAVPFFAKTGRPKLSDLAGRWKMTNRDTEEVLRGLKRFWSRWTS
jgi:hypothetical protein